MKIVVCVKQVPAVWASKFDPETKTLVRDGVPLEISSFDLRALACALRLRAEHGGEVAVITMGPPPARQTLEQCLALGADRGVHLCDPAFAGADTLATSRALAAAIGREGFDLILCGRYSVDAETGQVGPELAELLRIPHVTVARRIEVDSQAGQLRCERETDDGFETVEAPLPALVTAAEDLAEEPAVPDDVQAVAPERIETIAARDLGVDPSAVGQLGSPTWVRSLETIASSRQGCRLQGDSLEHVVDQLVAILLEKGLFSRWQVAAPAPRRSAAPVQRDGAADVWVFAERAGAGFRPVTYELLNKARELAGRLGSRVVAVVAGSKVGEQLRLLAQHGAGLVLAADDPRLEAYDPELYTPVLARAIAERKPGIVLFPSTVLGRDVAPRLAARLGLGLTGDCLDLDLDERGRLLQMKPAFGGSIVAAVLSKTVPEMATVRPGVFETAPRDERATAPVEFLPVPAGVERRIRVVSCEPSAASALELDRAEVVVGVGKGLGSKERLAELQPLLDVLGAAICATRDVTDAGWLPRQYQVGITGKSIAPRLYVGIGVRGAFYHLVGLRRAGLIVGINSDPKASIFKHADYGILGDYRKVVPLLVERLRAARARAQA